MTKEQLELQKQIDIWFEYLQSNKILDSYTHTKGNRL